MDSYLLILIFFVGIIAAYFFGYRTHKLVRDKITDNLILVDTNSLIDGRILEIAKSGFLTGRLIVFKFVLAELQYIADSGNHLKRTRGRRGLQVLKELQKIPGLNVEVIDEDIKEVKEVDEKLIRFAKLKNAKILTIDFNLNEVASVQGISVMNVNELSNAIKPLYLPGEELSVKVVQKGKEQSQGVGYLEDGTMIVVENGARFMNRSVDCVVKKIFQTDAGRMVFVAPKNRNGRGFGRFFRR